MTYFIDRRPNAKHKSAVNRQRFLERYRKHIKRSVEESVNRRSITDMERGEKISIPAKDISEPVFSMGLAGRVISFRRATRSSLQGTRSVARAAREAAMVRAKGALLTRVKGTMNLPSRLVGKSFLSSYLMAWSFPTCSESH